MARARARRQLPQPAIRRWLRVRAGLSQAALGTAIGVSRPTICRWESGRRMPRGGYALAYLDVLDKLAAAER